MIAATARGAITEAAATVRAGGVIAMPTDTVYGFAAALDRPPALARLFEMKERSASKAIPILLGSGQDVFKIARELPAAANILAQRFWPGALTIVLIAREGLPPEVLTRDSTGIPTVAVRVPANRTALEIIAAAGGALAVTSANLSGMAPARSALEIARMGHLAPDLIVDEGPAVGGIPSTIVRPLDGMLEIVREGAIPSDMIASAAGTHKVFAGQTRSGAV